MYPFDELPPDARRNAWMSRPTDTDSLNSPEVLQWQQIGPAPTTSFFPSNWGLTSGRINAIAVSSSNPNLVLIGAATGGIWRSTNGGATFAPTSDSQVDLAVGSIAFAPTDNSIVYAGMGDGNGGYLGTGVLKSTDGGQTWTRVSNSTLPAPGRILRIQVAPTNPNRVYVVQDAFRSGSSLFSSGFWVSNDGGVNWTKTLSGLTVDLVKHPTQTNTLYVALTRNDGGGTTNAGIFKSIDAGATWTRIYTSPFGSTSNIKIAVTSAAASNLYVLVGDGSTARVEVSSNEGGTWSNRGAAFDVGQFYYNCYLFVHPTAPNTIYVGTRDLWRSTDGGTTYTNITNNFSIGGAYTPNSSKAHPDQHYFYISPSSPNTIYIANDGGLWRSTDGAATFSSLNASLALTMFTSYDMHPTDATRSYGGTQDNGTQKRTGGVSWREFATGDGGQTFVDPLDPSIVYATYVYRTIFRYATNGDAFSATIGSDATFNNDRTGFYPPFVGNEVNSTLYFGTYRLYVSTNRGASWTVPGGATDLTFGFGVLSTIAVAKSNINFIYTGGSDGRVMVSTNGGANWTDRTAGIPQRFIKSIAVSPTDPNTAFLTVSGFGSGHVFKTTNAGASWANISGNLPDIPTNTLLIDPRPGNSNTLYVGTDIGVFRSTVGGSTWETFNNGLPPTIISELDAQPSGLMQAGTYGRAAYEINLNDVGSCTYSLDPTSRSFAASASSSFVNVITGSGCTWTATVNAPSLLEISSPLQAQHPLSPIGNLAFQDALSVDEQVAAPEAVFQNASPITINDRTSNSNPPGTASLYPSTINVSGMTGTITKVEAALSGLNHTFPDDVDVLLVGPGGQRAILMSDAGNNIPLSGVQLTFDQTAASTLPDGTQIFSGTYRPSNFAGNASFEPGGVDNFPAPGPGQTNYTADLNVFNGTAPNGAWQLYVVDDENVDSGSIATGWALGITTNSGGTTWINITSGSSGTGNGTVNYTVAANPGTTPRTGTITVNGQVHTVNQAGNTPAAGTVQFSSSTYNVNENGGAATITVTRAGGTAAFNVNYATSNGTAAAGSDFTATSGTLIFASGETSKTFSVPIIDDAAFEGNETVNLALSSATNGATLGSPSTAVLTIIDNESTPGISINDVSLNEGDSSTTAFTFSVNLSSPSAQSVSVNYGTANGTAAAGSDFTAASGTVTFNPNETSKPVTVLVNGDTAVEPNETFLVNLSNPVNATISDNQGIGTIINDDSATCTYSINPTSQNFPASGGSNSVQVTAPGGCGWTAVSNSLADSNNVVVNASLLNLPSGIDLLKSTTTGFEKSPPNTNSNAIATPAFGEDFDNIATLPASGWFMQNNSTPVGSTGWFQGNTAVFPAQSGASYIGANFNNTTGTNTISNWLLTPNITFNNGDVIRFWTRTATDNPFPDRLEVRLSTNGTSTNVGSGSAAVGDFTTLLLSVNPNLTTVDYPQVWTQYTLTISGLSGPTGGRMAFRYFVTGGGPTGNNSNYIGIDNFSYAPATTGSNWITITSGAGGSGNGTVQYSVASNNTGAPRTGTMIIAGQTFTVNQSSANTPRRQFDFDGDGKADLAVFRPSNGFWYIINSSNGALRAVQFGVNGDLIAPADFDGDGKTDICVFRPSNGSWYRLNSLDGSFYGIQFGANGDLPAPGDFDGDGKADITVYRPSAGSWYRLNSINGQFVGTQFGVAEDKPIVGDFDGDGKNDITVWRPSNGSWYRLNSSNGQFVGAQFGSNGDKPATADFDGDGRFDLVVYRPSNGYWYIIQSSNGAFIATQFGIAEDKAAPADFDGDGRADYIVFRPSNGTWYLLRSQAGFTGMQFGTNGDAAIPNAYVR